MCNKPIIIRPKDIQKVFNCSRSTASRNMSLLREVYKKKENQKVSIKEFCKYFDLSYNEVLEYI